jgi:hypothetical protein
MVSDGVKVWAKSVGKELASFAIVIAVVGLLLAWLDYRNHLNEMMYSKQKDCTSSLISLQADILTRIKLVNVIAGATDSTSVERATDSDIAVARDWGVVQVACQSTDLTPATTDVGRQLVTAQVSSSTSIVGSSSAGQLPAAVSWTQFAIRDVEKVEVGGNLVVPTTGFTQHSATYAWGEKYSES